MPVARKTLNKMRKNSKRNMRRRTGLIRRRNRWPAASTSNFSNLMYGSNQNRQLRMVGPQILGQSLSMANCNNVTFNYTLAVRGDNTTFATAASRACAQAFSASMGNIFGEVATGASVWLVEASLLWTSMVVNRIKFTHRLYHIDTTGETRPARAYWFVDRYNQLGNQNTGAFDPSTINPTSNNCLTFGVMAQTNYLTKKNAAVFEVEYRASPSNHRSINITNLVNALNASGGGSISNIELGAYLNGLLYDSPATGINAVANTLRSEAPHFNTYVVPVSPPFAVNGNTFAPIGSYIIKTDIQFNMTYFNKNLQTNSLNRNMVTTELENEFGFTDIVTPVDTLDALN